MPFLILAVFLWCGAALGMGSLFNLLIYWDTKENKNPSLGLTLFGGISVLGFLALILNFILPLSHTVSTAALSVGWLGLIGGWKGLRIFFGRKYLILWLLAFLATLSVAAFSHYNIDTGYYHLPSVVLSRFYPILPGIGNVAGPFGHVSTWFLLGGLFSLPGLGLSATFSLNSILCVAFVIFLFESEAQASLWGRSFILLSFLCLNHVILGLGGLTPDFPSYVLGSVIWYGFLESIGNPNHESDRLSMGFFLTIFAFTIKTSNLLILIPWMSWMVFEVRKKNLLSHRSSQILFTLGIFFLVCWFLRSVLASGCFLFPKYKTCIPQLPWTLPAEVVHGWLADVKFHLCGVRNTGSIFSESSCLTEWLDRMRQEPLLKYLLVFNCVALAVSAPKKRKGHKRSLLAAPTNQIAFTLIICLSTWMAVSPNPRFASWIFIAAGSLVMALLIQWGGICLSSRAPLFYGAILLGLVLSLRSAIVTRPTDWSWNLWPQIPEVKAQVFQTAEGLVIRKPEQGFQCWDIHPPCTPENSSVIIREGFWRRSVIIPRT